MRIQTEYSSYDFQAHLQRSQRRCCLSQTALLWFEVLPDMSLALQCLSSALPGAPRLVVGAPRLVAGAPSYSEGRQECPPRVWYSPEIDASKFTLHILSNTPGGFQWLKYILLMLSLLNVMCGPKWMPWIPLFWVLLMLVVQSSCFAIHFPPHIFHSNYLPMRLCLGWIRGTGEIRLLRVYWFFVGSILRWWCTWYVVYE